uniref:Uncharacterized protein n=1 Tax=Arundo donax TaxID=35708 RepID=A0A0A9HJ56_ARUDO
MRCLVLPVPIALKNLRYWFMPWRCWLPIPFAMLSTIPCLRMNLLLELRFVYQKLT